MTVAQDHFDALGNARSRTARARAVGALPRQMAHAKSAAPAFAKILAGVDAAGVTSRAALARLPVTRKSELLEMQKPSRLSAASPRPAGPAAGAACSPRPGRSTSPRARAPITGASRARCSPPASAAATSSTTPSLPLHAGRARCSRPARTRSAARCSRPAPARPSCRCRRSPTCVRRLRRHAVVPAASSSRRPTSWAWRCRRCARALVSGEAFLPPLRDALARARHRRATRSMPRRISA